MFSRLSFGLLLTFASTFVGNVVADDTRLLFRGVVVDETGKPVPARVYLRSGRGKWFHVES